MRLTLLSAVAFASSVAIVACTNSRCPLIRIISSGRVTVSDRCADLLCHDGLPDALCRQSGCGLQEKPGSNCIGTDSVTILFFKPKQRYSDYFKRRTQPVFHGDFNYDENVDGEDNRAGIGEITAFLWSPHGLFDDESDSVYNDGPISTSRRYKRAWAGIVAKGNAGFGSGGDAGVEGKFDAVGEGIGQGTGYSGIGLSGVIGAGLGQHGHGSGMGTGRYQTKSSGGVGAGGGGGVGAGYYGNRANGKYGSDRHNSGRAGGSRYGADLQPYHNSGYGRSVAGARGYHNQRQRDPEVVMNPLMARPPRPAQRGILSRFFGNGNTDGNRGRSGEAGGGAGLGFDIVGDAGAGGFGDTQMAGVMGIGGGTGAQGGLGVHGQGTGAGKGAIKFDSRGHAQGGMGGGTSGTIAGGAGFGDQPDEITEFISI